MAQGTISSPLRETIMGKRMKKECLYVCNGVTSSYRSDWLYYTSVTFMHTHTCVCTHTHTWSDWLYYTSVMGTCVCTHRHTCAYTHTHTHENLSCLVLPWAETALSSILDPNERLMGRGWAHTREPPDTLGTAGTARRDAVQSETPKDTCVSTHTARESTPWNRLVFHS